MIIMMAKKLMWKPLDVLRRLEKMAKKEFVPSIGPVKGRIITEIIKKYTLQS
jgi:hypothetical protein